LIISNYDEINKQWDDGSCQKENKPKDGQVRMFCFAAIDHMNRYGKEKMQKFNRSQRSIRAVIA
jgi:hypothetical protein